MVQDINMPAPGISRFEAALQRRADRLGVGVDQVLAHDRQALRSSRYPTADCLDPYEVELFFAAELSEERIAHVQNCPMCATTLDVVKPREPLDEAFSTPTEQEKVAPANIPSWRPAADAGALVALPLLAVGAATIEFGWCRGHSLPQLRSGWDASCSRLSERGGCQNG